MLLHSEDKLTFWDLSVCLIVLGFAHSHAGGDTGRLKDRRGSGSGDSYKVLLVDDARHTDKLVEKALPQVVPSITAEAARELFHKSRQKGAALVIVTVKVGYPLSGLSSSHPPALV